MDENKTKFTKKIEDTLACSAFAEAGEPCPIGTGDKKDGPPAAAKPSEREKKSALDSIENTMACSAYAEAGEPCPIESKKASAK